MKKISYILMMALVALTAFTSCKEDTQPRLQRPTEFVLNTPPMALNTYVLAENSGVELTCSQPDYGMGLVADYQVEVSMTEDFAEYRTLDEVYTSARFTVPGPSLAIALCEMLGYDSQTYVDTPVAVYVRLVASVPNCDYATITSNVIKLESVVPYLAVTGPSYLWTPGDANGWSHANSQLLATNDEGIYVGYAFLQSEFKFTNQPDWNGINYGDSGEAGVLYGDGGAGNLTVSTPGLYYCTVNLSTLKYSVTLMSTWGLIGSFNDWADSVAMTPSADFLTWKGTITLAADDEFKFRANDSWDNNLGGTPDALSAGGPNIPAPGAGTFEITLDFSSLPYQCTIVKQ